MRHKCDKKHELYWRPTNARRHQMQFNRPGDMALGIRLLLDLEELTEHCVSCGLVEKSSVFYGGRRLFTVFAIVRR
jgi:hypothetical protein